MKNLSFIILLFVCFNVFSQNNSLKKDSIVKNRYNKGKIFFGGSPGAGIYAEKNKGVQQFGINNFSEVGFFISNKTLLSIHGYYNYNKSVRNEHKGINVFSVSSRHSLTIRKYFHPNKLSFFSEFSFDYDNFYSHFTFYNKLPAEWFHVGSVSGGAGVNLFVYKFDIMLGIKYRYPVFYKNEVVKYSEFGFIQGIGFIFGTYFTF